MGGFTGAPCTCGGRPDSTAVVAGDQARISDASAVCGVSGWVLCCEVASGTSSDVFSGVELNCDGST